MSYIAFHTPTRTGYVSGAERAHLELTVKRLAAGLRRAAFGIDLSDTPSALRRAVNWPEEALVSNWATFDDRADLYIDTGNGDRHVILPTGHTAERVYDVNLNSVITVGTPTIRLAARITGQCEVHLFVEGTDRAWFADLIEHAIADDTFRAEASRYQQRDDSPNGWAGICDLARADSADPMVLSYSVCEWFPNLGIAAWPEGLPDQDDGPDGYDAAEATYVALSGREQWDRAMAGLRRKTEVSWLFRLSPDNLGEARFGTQTPLTWADIAEAWGTNVPAGIWS